MKLVAAVTSTQEKMKMILPMSSILKIALMTDNETQADLQNKILRRADKIQKLTEVEQINLENEWTEFLQNLVDYSNKHYLRNFLLCLEMVVDYEDDAKQNLGGRWNMRTNKKDFELRIAANDIPKDLELGLIGISIFKGNIVLRFADSDDGGLRDPIISKFNIEWKQCTISEKKLTNANLEAKPAQKLVTFIVEKILDKLEQSKSVPLQAIPEGLDYNDDTANDRIEYI
jgi:hypothetical protein